MLFNTALALVVITMTAPATGIKIPTEKVIWASPITDNLRQMSAINNSSQDAFDVIQQNYDQIDDLYYDLADTLSKLDDDQIEILQNCIEDVNSGVYTTQKTYRDSIEKDKV